MWGQDVPYEEEGGAAEGEEAPLVATDCQRADKAANDNDPGHERRSKDVGESEARGVEEEDEEQGEVDEPLDVPDKLGNKYEHIMILNK